MRVWVCFTPGWRGSDPTVWRSVCQAESPLECLKGREREREKVKEEAETLHHNVAEKVREQEKQSEGTGQNRQQEAAHWTDP